MPTTGLLRCFSVRARALRPLDVQCGYALIDAVTPFGVARASGEFVGVVLAPRNARAESCGWGAIAVRVCVSAMRLRTIIHGNPSRGEVESTVDMMKADLRGTQFKVC